MKSPFNFYTDLLLLIPDVSPLSVMFGIEDNWLNRCNSCFDYNMKPVMLKFCIRPFLCSWKLLLLWELSKTKWCSTESSLSQSRIPLSCIPQFTVVTVESATGYTAKSAPTQGARWQNDTAIFQVQTARTLMSSQYSLFKRKFDSKMESPSLVRVGSHILNVCRENQILLPSKWMPVPEQGGRGEGCGEEWG